ncbi:MAG: hypothetical protein JJ975_02845 [Bacteroidia bacterium]|nr:hypothetical protein [Bacteroidia bacterium]
MRAIYASIALIMTLVVWSAANIMWSGDHHVGIIKADGKGYYAHLPAVFIYDDLNFGFYDSLEAGKYFNPNFIYDYRKQYNGKTLNKYYCGTAIPMMPFFLGAHVYAKNSDYPADGYSKPYNVSISIAAIVFLLLSLLILVKILEFFGIQKGVIALVLPVLVFGTNWYYYVVSEPAVSHVYSVFFISWFVWLVLKWSKTGKLSMILTGLLVGLIVLIRPANGIILACIPFLFPNLRSFWKAFVELFKKPSLITGVLLALAVVALQLVVYKIQTDHYLIYSYEEEGFNFASPEIFNILFSYKKGLFIYTPITLIALLGIWPWARVNVWQALGSLVFFGLLTYILSSWWNWYYGGSFSSRVYLDYMFVFAIPLAFLLNAIKVKWLKRTTISVLLVLVLFCQFQTYQYRRMIIHWDSMDKDTYWEVFLDVKGLMK